MVLAREVLHKLNKCLTLDPHSLGVLRVPPKLSAKSEGVRAWATRRFLSSHISSFCYTDRVLRLALASGNTHIKTFSFWSLLFPLAKSGRNAKPKITDQMVSDFWFGRTKYQIQNSKNKRFAKRIVYLETTFYFFIFVFKSYFLF